MGCTSSEVHKCSGCGVPYRHPGDKQSHKCWDLRGFVPILNPIFCTALPSPQEYWAVSDEEIMLKIPIDERRTKYKWVKSQSFFYTKKLKQFTAEHMKNKPFQEKLYWFRAKMQEMRISWQQGCDHLKVSRSNLLMTSKVGIQKLNLKKQIKIQFDDEEVEDAGGLLREWMHLTIKQIFSPEIGIFQLCQTDQTAYKFVWDEDLVQQYVKEHMIILGIIVGKAIFQRISLNCYLNRTILRQICQQPIHLHDVYSFDKDFYKQWNQILHQENVLELGLDFSIMPTIAKNKARHIKLIPNGDQVTVTDENKQKYVEQLIKMYCTKSARGYLQALLEGIYKVIPPKYLSIFQPYELQMMLNGPSVIDVKDWKQNTDYDGYTNKSNIIVWFWQIVMEWDQQKLGHLLHYCTGSKCVPILGFKYLQSNRNTICRFKIKKASINPSNPYPKSYTCFNRLELPTYGSFDQLKQKLQTLVREQLNNFGLD